MKGPKQCTTDWANTSPISARPRIPSARGWHEDRVWVGEVEASYVLADHSILGPVSKVFIVRMAPEGIEELRVYAAVEPSFHEARIRHERERNGMMVGGRWVPPL
jgi:hypothetical protein